MFFTEHLPLVDSRYSALFYFRIEKGRSAFEEEENEVLQRNIKENSNNIVQNQEQEQQLVVSRCSEPSTSLYCSSGSREWTDNEIMELIAIWKEEEVLYNIRHPVCYIKQDKNYTKQY